MAERMIEAATRHPEASGLRRRALNQLARELLLAQASDWAFILKTQTHIAYAYRRVRDHVSRFTHLYEAINRNAIDEAWLSEVEAADTLFPSLDYRIYATSNGA
jgi:1,4-alpha-glucan branching enzyme